MAETLVLVTQSLCTMNRMIKWDYLTQKKTTEISRLFSSIEQEIIFVIQTNKIPFETEDKC